MVCIVRLVLQMLLQVILAIIVALLRYVYKALQPPPPKKCGSADGPPVTSPRIRLTDGRHISYREFGVSKDKAKYKIIVIHGFDSSKDQNFPVSQELVEELKLYLVYFDRPGYGESDPHPRRSVRSEAHDVQELADALQLGSKFYVIGISLGAYPAWGCIRYIPQRLAGISLVVPFIHYWWPRFPSELSREAWQKLPVSDQWTFRIARHCPWLLHLWTNQKWFPARRLVDGSRTSFTKRDLEIFEKRENIPKDKIRPQGVYESLMRDLMSSFSDWGFSPLDLENPFAENEGTVQLWQGYEDIIIPFEMNRFIASKLKWIKYHEIPNGGHLFMYEQIKCEEIIRALVLG